MDMISISTTKRVMLTHTIADNNMVHVRLLMAVLREFT